MKSVIQFLLVYLFCLSTVGADSLTEEQRQRLDLPDPSWIHQIEVDVEGLQSWYSATASSGYAFGRQMTTSESQFAAKLGIANPQFVRIVETDTVPYATEDSDRRIFARYGIFSGGAGAAGLTLGQTIFVDRKLANMGLVIRHELTHVRQIEEKGTVAFLRRYLLELKVVGYEHAPLESEANRNMYR